MRDKSAKPQATVRHRGSSGDARSRATPSLFADPSRGGVSGGDGSTSSSGSISKGGGGGGGSSPTPNGSATDVAGPQERVGKKGRSFVAYNHPPPDLDAKQRGAGARSGGGAALARLHAATATLANGSGAPRRGAPLGQKQHKSAAHADGSARRRPAEVHGITSADRTF